MRPISHDDSLRDPERPVNGLAILEQNVKTFSPVAILYSSDHQFIPGKRTSELKRFNQQ